MRYAVIILVALATMVGCRSAVKPVSAPRSYRFRAVEPPRQATDRDKVAYMQEHYWDNFDFSDTLYTSRADTVEMMHALAGYVQHFVGPYNRRPIDSLMRRAATSRAMLDYFAMLAERVLHDPNSPLRSDELYIAVLEALIASPYYDAYEKLAPQYDLDMARKNRVGHVANDIDFTLSDGSRASLYNLTSDYTLIYINNPGCAMCRDITTALRQSPLITDMVRRGHLTILAIYPDSDLTAWREHASTMPREWLNGYDRGCVMSRTESYDLRAIPALYLLDAKKRVLIKDSTSVPHIEYVLRQRGA